MLNVTPEQLKNFVLYAQSLPQNEDGSPQFFILEGDEPDLDGWFSCQILGAVVGDLLSDDPLAESQVVVSYKSRMSDDGSQETRDYSVTLVAK